MIPIDEALEDKKLLGAALGDPESWQTWITCAKAAYAQALSTKELKSFKEVSGGRNPPKAPAKEFIGIAGRRAGKTRIAAALATYEATFNDHSDKLSPGEEGFIIIISPTKPQSKIAFGYIKAFLQSSPILRKKVKKITGQEIRLYGNITVVCHAADDVSIRGRTILCCIFDESGFWRSAEVNVNDMDIYRAVLPSLAATDGLLIVISSPYRQLGLLHRFYEDSFGKDDADTLVIKGPTLKFHPTFSKERIERAYRRDPQGAVSEWEAEFVSDSSQFLDDELIDDAINADRPQILQPQADIRYFGYVDPSAGRGDGYVIAIGHRDDDKFILDLIKGKAGKFNPAALTSEYAALFKSYKCNPIYGDNYSGEWVSAAYRKAGIEYKKAKLNKSQIYLEALPVFVRGGVEIPKHKKLITELRLLQRKSRASGDQIDHPPRANDDYANALAGCIHFTMQDRKRPRVSTVGPKIFKADPAFDPMGFSRGI